MSAVYFKELQMSNLSTLDQLRVLLNARLGAPLRPLRVQWLREWETRTKDAAQVVGQLTYSDLVELDPYAVEWVVERYMCIDQLPFEQWVGLLMHKPMRPLKVKTSVSSAEDSPTLAGPELKSKEAWSAFEMMERLFASAPQQEQEHIKDITTIQDLAVDMLRDTLTHLPVEHLSKSERARIATMLLNLPPLLFPLDERDVFWGKTPLAWIGEVAAHAQHTNHPQTVEWEARALREIFSSLDNKRVNWETVLQRVLANFVTDENALERHMPLRPKSFAPYKKVLAIVDKHLPWSEQNKQKFLPASDSFIKMLRRKITPENNVGDFLSDVFNYPIERAENAHLIQQELAQRFQVYLFFSVFANAKTELVSKADALNKIPASLLQTLRSTAPLPLDLKTVEDLLVSTARETLKSTLVRLLSSKKRKDDRNTQLREMLLNALPAELANSAQLVLHWAAPETYPAPTGPVVPLLVSKSTRARDSADMSDLRAQFLKHTLLHNLGEKATAEVAARVARKM